MRETYEEFHTALLRGEKSYIAFRWNCLDNRTPQQCCMIISIIVDYSREPISPKQRMEKDHTFFLYRCILLERYEDIPFLLGNVTEYYLQRKNAHCDTRNVISVCSFCMRIDDGFGNWVNPEDFQVKIFDTPFMNFLKVQ